MSQPRNHDLPAVPRALKRSMVLAYRAEPRLLVLTFVLMVSAAIPDALAALWLKLLADGVTEGRGGKVAWAAGGLAGSTALGWFLRTVGMRANNAFSQRATVELEAHVARLHANVASIEHLERPEFLDRLQILRDYVFLLNHFYGAFFGTIASIARLGFTVALLASVHPVLLVLPAFAVPTVIVSIWRAGAERRTEEGVAPDKRRARHLFELATSAGPGKEIRVTGTVQLLEQRHRETRDAWIAPVARARWVSAGWHAAAWALFGAAYAGGVVFVAAVVKASAGSVLLALAAGGRLSQFIGTTVGEADFLRWTIDASRHLVWLEDWAASHTERADTAAPDRLTGGIALEHVSFCYPGTGKTVLDDVNLRLPAGAVVAVVGENGAGKSTLVKLLCKFYEPSSGRITADGIDLSRVGADDWRSRVAGAFQDFFRFEFPAQRTVGVGDLQYVDERVPVGAAVTRAGADDVVERLPSGLDTQLGPTWEGGVELSFGQWQKLALARGLMREGRAEQAPLLLVLDEPTAALDAETEHALFERFAAASREHRDDGRITVLVSHRFSTVRMADVIVVLDGSRVVEHGSHEELMALGGAYAELYGIQAAAYR